MRRGVPARLARLAGALVVLGLALSGCSAVAAERPTVVVTTNILGDVTRNLVGTRPRWWCSWNPTPTRTPSASRPGRPR
ncbi:hypothetical protein [Arthrobacter sp. SD76]|uniref:hypothetical protein n=1 Tax=Arthrobacter sp. SD76 TaxID=3415007 RepID=UPI003C73F423